MKKQIKVKKEYNTLDKLLDFVKNESTLYESSKSFDRWDYITDSNGQMVECIVVKKSSMHGLKLHFSTENTLGLSHIIPSKVMFAFFGKSHERRRNIFEIITGKIKQLFLSSSQKKNFKEMAQLLDRITEL